MVLAFLAGGLPAGAQPISGEFWVRKDMLEILIPGENVRETEEYSERERAAIDNLLEDARWAFSGMIYGFDISWTPSATARNVEEEFTLTPVALILRGDPRLRASAVVEENNLVYIRLEYRPDDSQKARLEGWAGQTFPAASGMGSAPMYGGLRREAMEQAVKEAVRAWLRAREFNKPKEISGRVALIEFPLTGLSHGAIQASVSLRLDLKPLRHYPAD